MSAPNSDLEAIVADYVAIVPYNKSLACTLVHRFHEWVASEHPSMTQLDLRMCDEFMETPWAQGLADKTRYSYRGVIHRYIRWRAGTYGPPGHWSRVTRAHLPVPATVLQYLAAIEPNRRESTCQRYRDILRELHDWLQSRHVDISSITRDDAADYCRWLHEMGLSIATRRQVIAVVRTYLRYLAVHDHLPRHPDTIFIAADMPKLPLTLPRALPPDVDEQLCRRLAESTHPVWRALLVMRNTGIRVGELRRLPLDCVHAEPRGYRYLKVPIGKLNNERLVPLDDDTLTIIESLQKLGPSPREWLLPGRATNPLSCGTYRRALAIASAGLAADKHDALRTQEVSVTPTPTATPGTTLCARANQPSTAHS